MHGMNVDSRILTNFMTFCLCRIRSVFMRRSAMEIKQSRLESMKPLEFLPEVKKNMGTQRKRNDKQTNVSIGCNC